MKELDILIVPLALIVLVLFRLFKDKNSRLFPSEKPLFGLFQSEEYKGSSLTNLIVLVIALIGSYCLIWFIKWLWMRS